MLLGSDVLPVPASSRPIANPKTKPKQTPILQLNLCVSPFTSSVGVLVC